MNRPFPGERGFGALLRGRRAAAGLTQEELAAQSGLSVRAVRDMECGWTGRPYRFSVDRLAAALGLSGPAREEFVTAARAGDRARRVAGRLEPDGSAGARGGRLDDDRDHVPAAGGLSGAGWGSPQILAVVPRQLPPAVPYFAGRASEFQALTALLAQAPGVAGMVVITAVGGTAGIGKTALAVYWAHSVADRFPDGQLYVNLRGFDPSGEPVTPGEAVRGFLDALAVPVPQRPPGVDAQVGLYRSLLAGKRMLVVLDNARDANQVRPLLPGGPGCLVVVTSRSQLTGLVASDGAYPIWLDLLSSAESLELLAARLGVERIAREQQAAAELIELCARLPLALNIAAARATPEPAHDLAALVAELHDANRRLDVLDAGEPASSLRATFSWSYQQLSPPAAQMFRLLGVHPGPDVSVAGSASLAGTARAQAHQALAELASAQLIAEHSRGRFAFHDLLRAYAAECAEREDGATGRSAALRRALGHYLHTAYTADRILYPTRPEIALAEPGAGVTPETLHGSGQALSWFRSEHRVLLSAVAKAHAQGLYAHTWQLAWAMSTFLNRQGHSRDWADVMETALKAAVYLGDKPAQARVLMDLGYARARLGCDQDARADLRRALDLFTELGDPTGQAQVHNAFTVVLERQGQPREALGHARQVLALCRAAGHLLGQARALNAIGWYQCQLGQYQAARKSCQQALRMHRELGDHDGEAATWDSLGYVHHRTGQHAEAVSCYQRALALFENASDQHYQSITFNRIGDAYLAAGQPANAQQSWRKALAILGDEHHPDAARIRAKLTNLAAS